jgi:hypothetical protein
MSEMHEDLWKVIISVLGGVTTVGGFLNWHFKIVNGFKDEIHRLDLKNKELEQNDRLQQKEVEGIKNLMATENARNLKSSI